MLAAREICFRVFSFAGRTRRLRILTCVLGTVFVREACLSEVGCLFYVREAGKSLQIFRICEEKGALWIQTCPLLRFICV